VGALQISGAKTTQVYAGALRGYVDIVTAGLRRIRAIVLPQIHTGVRNVR